MEKIFINSKDGYKLDIHIFKVDNPKAAIQIIHGLEEHQERYENFIEELNKNGFSVVSSNIRGHGSSAKDLELLLLRGLDDPCTGGDKGSKDSKQVLYKAGFSKIKSIDYPNMRHEILAEKENKKVYNDVINFFSINNNIKNI